jgi:hypothetical protein
MSKNEIIPQIYSLLLLFKLKLTKELFPLVIFVNMLDVFEPIFIKVFMVMRVFFVI